MRRISVIMLLLVILVVSVVTVSAADHRSTNPVYWWWEDEVGSSTIVRTDSGVSANLHTSELPKGQAMTLWFVVFNYPNLCDGGCGEDEVLGVNHPAMTDVLYAAGNVVGGSGKTAFGAHLSSGDTSGSINPGLPEPKEPVGLENPTGAEIHLVLRSHGPKNPEYMPAQILTFPGGCQNNWPMPGGGPGELKLGPGDCQDIQFSVHEP